MTLTGRDVLLEVLATEGVELVFGNPGTTELPFLDALAGVDRPTYVLSLHEGTAVGMADGYARVTRRPSFLNLHTAAGMGNAMGLLANVRATRTPMVVTAGQQHQGHLLAEPFLSGELVEMAAPMTKWAREVHRVDDLGTVLRRAFREARHQPAGPVFVSLPMDVLDAPAACPPPPATTVEERVVPEALDRLAAAMADVEAGRFAVVASDDVARSEAVAELVAVADRLACPVFAAPLHSSTVFPSLHPLWAGALPPDAVEMRRLLGRFDAVLLIGERGFMTFGYRDVDPLPEGLELLHLASSASDLGRTYPASLAMVGDPKATLARMLRLLEDVPSRASARPADTPPPAEGAHEGAGLDPEAVVRAILASIPVDTAVVEEAPTADALVRRFHRTTRGDQFFYSRGGGLGWGMGAAMGVSLGTGGEPVLCIVGDGSALYSPQALWTAAHLRIPVTFAVLNNGSYLILKQFLHARGGPAAATGRFPGMDLGEPSVDFGALSRSFGVRAVRPQSVDEAADAVSHALTSGGPYVVEVPVQASAADASR